ncbi:MAG TPA: prevent-host-death protein [Lachnospiraceae bacterium]|nr:prevent-host-death protein [Lachnospiraceae bacterium]
MVNITVSELRDYNAVLGKSKYTIRDMEEDEEFEKTKAICHLMRELNEGRRSGEEEGYVSSDDVKAYFRCKRLQSTELRHIGGREI